DLDFTTSRSAWISAVNAMVAGGGSDSPEAQYEALYQVVTGHGRDIPGTSRGDIPAGHQAHFRADATRVIAITTDAGFHAPGDSTCGDVSPPCPLGWPGPSRDQTVGALQGAHARVIAIQAPGSGSEMEDLVDSTAGALESTDSSSKQIADAIVE